MKTKADRARELLTEHADDLRGQIERLKMVPPLRSTHEGREFVGPAMQSDIDRLEFIAGAIDRFLDGKAKSMDHALGLKRGRGNPGSMDGNPGMHFEMVLRIIPLIYDGKTWDQIIDQLHEEGEFEFYDGPRELEKVYERERVAAMEWYAERNRQN